MAIAKKETGRAGADRDQEGRHGQGDRRPRQGQDRPRAEVDRETGKVLVEHVMMIKRHTRPNPAKQIKGGIAERESPIQVSNVMIVCPGCDKAVRDRRITWIT